MTINRRDIADTLVDYVIWCGHAPDASALDIAQYARHLLTGIEPDDASDVIARFEADIAAAKRRAHAC